MAIWDLKAYSCSNWELAKQYHTSLEWQRCLVSNSTWANILLLDFFLFSHDSVIYRIYLHSGNPSI